MDTVRTPAASGKPTKPPNTNATKPATPSPDAEAEATMGPSTEVCSANNSKSSAANTVVKPAPRFMAASLNESMSRPIFFTLGLRREKNFPTPRFPISASSSFALSGSLKNSRSSKAAP